MEETLVFVDEGLLKELVEYFGDGKRLKFDKFDFAKRLAKKQGLFCKHLFYYTCPPFQSDAPTEDEAYRKQGHDKFVNALSKNKNITIREGRCQRLKIDGEYIYKQKEVDNLLTIDMGHIKDDFPEIKKVILVSSDTDFCPSIRDVKKRNKIEVILYTYFDRERKSKFSLSNELIDCCSKYFKLTKEDFTSCSIKKWKNKK